MKLLYYSNGMNDTRVRVRREDWSPDQWELLSEHAFEELQRIQKDEAVQRFFPFSLQNGAEEE